MKNFALIGNPIAHSKSPKVHQMFAKQFGLIISYEKILAPVDAFAKTVNNFFTKGGDGCNITLPFKNEAYKLCDGLTTDAQLAEAVNTIKIVNNKLVGHNTDGIGLVNDLINNLAFKLTNKTILILGAGGATRGILAPLLSQEPKRLMIANRTAIKAQELAKKFAQLGNTCGFGLEKIKPTSVDVIINATSTSLINAQINLPQALVKDAFCYDLMYGKKSTFLEWAKGNGAQKTADGYGMLVEQAALSFVYWTGKTPTTKGIIRALT